MSEICSSEMCLFHPKNAMFPHVSRSTTTDLTPFQVSSQPLPLPRSDTSSQCLRWGATVGLSSWDCWRTTQVNSPCLRDQRVEFGNKWLQSGLENGLDLFLCCTRCTCMRNNIYDWASGSWKRTIQVRPIQIDIDHNMTLWFVIGMREESLIHEWQLDVAAMLRKHLLSAASSEPAASRCTVDSCGWN